MASRKTRLLHVITTASVGGAERHLLSLLRGIPKDRFDITLAFFKEEAQEARSLVPDFRALGIDIVDLDMRSGIDFRPIWRLGKLIARLKPDIVHTHLYRADIAGINLARLLRVKAKVASVHNLDLETNYRRIRRPVLNAYRHADGIVAISEAVRRELVVRYGIGADRVHTIHYGLDVEDWPDPDRRSRPTGFVVGTIGRLAHQKGYDVLLEAFAAVHEKVPLAALRIVGHDDEGLRMNLIEQARTLGIDGAVSFEGYSDRVQGDLLGWDVFALASRWEGFGLVLLEAMAAGLPVVATRVGPVPEISLDEVTAVLVPAEDSESLANALLRLLTDEPLRRRLGAAGRERFIESFSSSRTVAETILTYERLLAIRG